MGKQNPYCAMRLGKEAKKTDTDRRGGQTPKWDQELRFTVHESPDYYRLKCSVFNDDKRTDLIGEAWVDLSDLIKPGGGSNDLWHQLNYKGKYAGDIRVELTYYDLRPREEKLSDKKKHREKLSTIISEGDVTSSAPRQLGPRDVRRRPLPTNPAPTGVATENASTKPVSIAPETNAPAPPPKVPFDQPNTHYLHSERLHSDDVQYGDNRDNVQHHNLLRLGHHYRQPFCEDQSSTAEISDELVLNSSYVKPEDASPNGFASSVSPSTSIPPLSWSEEVGNQQQIGYDRIGRHSISSQEQLAIVHAPRYPSTTASEPQYYAARCENTIIKPTPSRDGSSRHSMVQQDLDMLIAEEPDSYDPPPPPPKHRETTPRKQQIEYPPTSFPHYEGNAMQAVARPSGNTSRRASIEERSPLQHIEDEYFEHMKSQLPHHDPYRKQNYYDADYNGNVQQTFTCGREPYRTPERHDSYDRYSEQEHSPHKMDRDHQGAFYDTGPEHSTYHRPQYRSRNNSYDGRRSSGCGNFEDDNQAVVPHSRSQVRLSTSNQYNPQSVRASPPGAGLDRPPQRKAVSPASYARPNSQRSSAIPFNPDSYDFINPKPGSGAEARPVYQNPQEAKEFTRTREAANPKDQGPIIGNDGRVIDPSDHLPSDTWAPEPERKNRRPEHVIHYRMKKDSRSHTIPSSLPSSTRSDYRQSASNSITSIPSPASASTPSSRNRLPNQVSTRPLPSQPYPQATAHARYETPAEVYPPIEPLAQQAVQRYSYHDPSPAIRRPNLSEYQVAASNAHRPRGSSFSQELTPSPNARMHAGRDYNPRNSNYFDDPLAVELSMIDIGPSRPGQMVLSGRRGY